MDPVTGQGISHAFRDAELLADAAADGLGGIRPLAGALRGYHRARDRAARPMYDFTARLAAISPTTSAESALFRALARRQQDADMFVGALAGSVPLRQFMSPRTMVRLVGVGGFARLAFGQSRPRRPGPHAPDQPGRLEKLPGTPMRYPVFGAGPLGGSAAAHPGSRGSLPGTGRRQSGPGTARRVPARTGAWSGT
jgi:hypothetical protein